MSKPAGSVKLIVTLTVAGLLSGLALVSVYLLTKPIIEQNHAEALQRALFRILPGITTTTPFIVKEGNLAPVPKGSKPPPDDVVYAGYSKTGKFVGFGVPAQGPGFQDVIGLIYGYSPVKKMIIGMEVLESRETPGLGDKITKDKTFLHNFVALAVEPGVVMVKHGTKSHANEIDAISGATISSRAVTGILKKSLARWRPLLDTAKLERGTP